MTPGRRRDGRAGREAAAGSPAATSCGRSRPASAPAFFADVETRRTAPARAHASAAPDGGVLQVARPLDEVDATLGTLRSVLAAVVLGGVGGRRAGPRLPGDARRGRPRGRLTDAAEHVARTRDLTRRIEHEGDDELARLAAAFNTMLEALESSRARSGGSSRTRRTSCARRSPPCAPTSRCWARAELRRGRPREAARRRDRAARGADAARRRPRRPRARGRAAWPSARSCGSTSSSPRRWSARGATRPACASRPTSSRAWSTACAARLDRAVANLLDNAAKWSPPGGTVEVLLRDGRADRARPRAGHRRTRTCRSSSTASTARRRRAAGRAPGSGSRSCARRPRRTAAASHAATAPDGGAVLRLALSPSS